MALISFSVDMYSLKRDLDVCQAMLDGIDIDSSWTGQAHRQAQARHASFMASLQAAKAAARHCDALAAQADMAVSRALR